MVENGINKMTKKTYKSLPSTERANLEQYWDIVRRLEPEFYLIRIALQETKVNPLLVPRIVRAIANLYIGTRFGKVTIYMQNGKVTMIDGIESDRIEEDAVIGGEK